MRVDKNILLVDLSYKYTSKTMPYTRIGFYANIKPSSFKTCINS